MNIDFDKTNGLVPVIIQHIFTGEVLMLGFMNAEAYKQTLAEKKVTFFSRSKNRLWTKGETSGHFLHVHDVQVDCDGDTLLIKAQPSGPVCHTGTDTCFGNSTNKGFIYNLEQTINQRINTNDEKSYTNALYKKGMNKVAQKVGEEAVELVIEAMATNNKELFLNEAADLMYHYLILLKAKGFALRDVEDVLAGRK